MQGYLRRGRRSVDRDDDVHRLEVARSVRAGDQLRDDDPGRSHDDVVAEPAESNGGCDPLGEGHLLQLRLQRLLRAGARWHDVVGRLERGVRVDPGEDLL